MIGLQHSSQAIGNNNPSRQISKDAWNANHLLTGTANTLLGFDDDGNATELSGSGIFGLIGLGVMALSLFTSATSKSVPVGTNTVETTGYSSEGLGGARYVYDAAVDSAYVTANPRSSFITANGRGFRLGTQQVILPEMLGAKGDNVADDGAAINATYAFTIGNGVAIRFRDTTYAHSIPLICDGGVAGSDTFFSINYGNCYFRATVGMDHQHTLQNVNLLVCTGHVHLYGPGRTSNAIADWTVMTNWFVSSVGECVMPHITCEAFGFAGIETSTGLANNDECQWGHIYGKRGASGNDDPFSWKSNYTGATVNGTDGTDAQYVQLPLDAMPPAYVTANSGAPDYTPTKRLRVEINGRLHTVTYCDPVNKVIRAQPAFLDSELASGTVRWHYGSLVYTPGTDSNIMYFPYISGNAAGSLIDFCTLFNARVGSLHGENIGVGAWLGQDTHSTSIGGGIEAIYLDGNNYGLVEVGEITSFSVGMPAGGSLDYSKNYRLGQLRISPTAYSAMPKSQLAIKGEYGGYHYARQSLRLEAGFAYHDLGQPVAYDHPTYTTDSSDNCHIVMFAPSAALVSMFGNTTNDFFIVGNGTNGAVEGTITITPPTGWKINALSTNADYILATNSFGSRVSFDCKIDAVNNVITLNANGNKKAAGTVLTYAAPAGGSTVDAECRASLAQLAADLEALRQHMHTAGQIGTSAANLITNGDGTTISGWTVVQAVGCLSATGGRLRLTGTDGNFPEVTEEITGLTPGANYIFTASGYAGTGGSGMRFFLGSTNHANDLADSGNVNGDYSKTFTAPVSGNIWVTMLSGASTAGNYNEADNLVLLPA